MRWYIMICLLKTEGNEKEKRKIYIYIYRKEAEGKKKTPKSLLPFINDCLTRVKWL